MTYVVNQGVLLTAPITISQDAACNLPFTYTQAFVKEGLAISQPTWITFDSTTTMYTIESTLPADIGTYKVTTMATIPQIDPDTGFNRVKESFYIV